MSIQENSPAPGFSLETDTLGPITLEQWRGRPVVLYFYPKDNTPGCTLEAKDFTDNQARFEAYHAVVVGVSKDSVPCHRDFRTKHHLSVILASDPTGQTCTAYGVWQSKSMFGKKYMGIDRSTFLIDGQGIIRRIWRGVSVSGHVKAVLEALAALPLAG